MQKKLLKPIATVLFHDIIFNCEPATTLQTLLQLRKNPPMYTVLFAADCRLLPSLWHTPRNRHLSVQHIGITHKQSCGTQREDKHCFGWHQRCPWWSAGMRERKVWSFSLNRFCCWQEPCGSSFVWLSYWILWSIKKKPYKNTLAVDTDEITWAGLFHAGKLKALG